jgi:hypothetical protein
MSHTDLVLTLGRIEEATPRSQIAVFRYNDREFDTVFANTIRTQQLIKGGSHEYVGSFDRTDNRLELRNKLGSMLVAK